MSFDLDDPIGREVRRSIEVEIGKRFPNNTGEAADLAEYICVLVASNTDVPTIIKELRDITEINIEADFILELLQYINILVANGVPPQVAPTTVPAAAAAAAAAVPVTNKQQIPEFPNTAFLETSTERTKPTNPRDFRRPTSDRTQTRGIGGATARNNLKGGINKGGIGKTGNDRTNSHRKGPTDQTQKKFEKALSSNNQNVNIHNIPKGRCPDFPYCKNKECPKSHPTKNCFLYPNCPNAPGTCNYLHPDQDQELIQKLEVSKQEFEKKKQFDFQLKAALCKYGLECGKDTCPFVHPTPANKDAKIDTLSWCEAGKNCLNKNCTMAHPPPSSAAIKSAPSAKELALEQCKFGTACKKPKCPRRHATSSVPCREGGDCRRLDCTFAHPFNEDCRFGAACSNKYCLYKHPAERVVKPNTWIKDDEHTDTTMTVGTSSRAFAVADDQVSAFSAQG
ncbi:uncharacterized protein RJT21DRAFT_120384 [Scheffersomyces amazonensis]|uniref:uncharacterized protein n=1 Tax=Scheffersomyces amazonensis TaxID=1078765 RepID=UPI00315D06CA